MSILEKFGKNVIAKYENPQSKGIFYELRKIKSPISTLDVEITSKDSYISSRYCSLYVQGSNPQSLIDGNSNTAWANTASLAGYPSFIIHFKNSHFQLQHYSIKSPCNPPPGWLIKGSNNNIDWNLLDEKSGITHAPNQEYFYSVFDSKKKLSFEYFNFSIAVIGRLHLDNIEFYGILNPISKLTCKENKYNLLSYSYLFIFLIK